MKKISWAIVPWLLLVFTFVKALAVPLYDPDLWWHLAAGREMVKSASILRSDIFSHTLAGQPWINFEWLSQLVLYALVKAGGLEAVFFARIVFCLSSLAFLAWACHAAGARKAFLFACVWLGFLVARPRLMERAELVTLNFLPLLIGFLLWAQTVSGERRKKIPWMCGALFTLWANAHGGFIFGLGVLALINAGARLAGKPRAVVHLLDSCFTFSLAGILINPYGFYLPLILVEHLVQLGWSAPVIAEWGVFPMWMSPAFWMLLVFCGVVVAIGIKEEKKRTLFWLPAAAIFGIWGTLGFRNSSLFAFIALPFAADVLSAVWKRRSKLYKFNYLKVVVYVFPFLLLYRTMAAAWPGDVVRWAVFPVKAAQFISEAGMKGLMYNSYQFGGYLDWRLGPEKKVFMDGRYLFQPLLVEQQALNDRLLIDPFHSLWPDYLSAHKTDYAVVDYGDFSVDREIAGSPFDLSPLNIMFPRSRWALVFWDDVALVFVRRDGPNAELIRRHEVRWLWPHNLQLMIAVLRGGEVSIADAAAEMDRHWEWVGPTRIGRTIQGIIIGITRERKN